MLSPILKLSLCIFGGKVYSTYVFFLLAVRTQDSKGSCFVFRSSSHGTPWVIASFKEHFQHELFSSVLSLAVASTAHCPGSYPIIIGEATDNTALGTVRVVFLWCWVQGLLVLWVGEVLSPYFSAVSGFFVHQSLLTLGVSLVVRKDSLRNPLRLTLNHSL